MAGPPKNRPSGCEAHKVLRGAMQRLYLPVLETGYSGGSNPLSPTNIVDALAVAWLASSQYMLSGTILFCSVAQFG